MRRSRWLVFFFFQAEDGIRDYKVTGVQTCALPICHRLEVRSVAEDEALVRMTSEHRLLQGLLAQVLVVTLPQPLLDVVDGVLAQAPELRGVPARVEDHIGDEGEELRQVVLVHASHESGQLLVHPDVQLGGERKERLEQLLRAQRLPGALCHHARGQIGEAGFAARDVDRTGAETDLDVDDRVLVRGQLEKGDAGGKRRDLRSGGNARFTLRRRGSARGGAGGPSGGFVRLGARSDDAAIAFGFERCGGRRIADRLLLLRAGNGEGKRSPEDALHRPSPFRPVTSVTVVRFRSMKLPLAKSCRSRGCTVASAANSLFRWSTSPVGAVVTARVTAAASALSRPMMFE